MIQVVQYGQKLNPCFICNGGKSKIFCKHCKGEGHLVFGVWHIEGVEYGHGGINDPAVSDCDGRILIDEPKN